LSKTPNKEASPATARQARHTTEKYSLLFSFCARRFFSSKRKKTFVRGSALNEQDGRAVRFLYSLGRGGIPPTPSFRLALALADEIFCGGL